MEQLTPPDQPRVRRRLVQSTLFPIKSEEEVEEPIQKKKRETKPRTSSKKVAAKGQETLNGRIDDTDSSAKLDLLADLSEGQFSQTELLPSSQAENNGACSPLESTPDMKSPRKTRRRASTTPKKKQLQTTPRKKTRNGNLEDAYPEKMLDCSPQNGNVIQVPDLRLEAKMKAEENARMFSGRKIHPFFSSRKVEKKNQETIDVDNWCPSEKKNRITSLGPIHVFEKVQDNPEPMDWGNYKFSERSFTGTYYVRECSPFSGKPVDSLRFDDFVSLSLSRESLPLIEDHSDRVRLNQSAFEQEQRAASSPILIIDEPVADCELITDITMNQEDCGMQKIDFVCRNSDSLKTSDAEWEGRFLHGRMMTYYQGTDRHPDNSLWTNKFLPEKAVEVCGNCESVNFLSEWLRLWNEKGFCSRKDINAGEETRLQGDGYNCYGSDGDSENRDEANGLKNVLLISGPVGSGKSAAIYACAKEQGFHVIEVLINKLVNASDWRTRALVMQKFEGGMESYWVQRTVETPVDSESKCVGTSFAAMFSTKAVQGSEHEVTEVLSLSDEEDSPSSAGTAGKFVCESNNAASDRCENKPLILFEDVDAVLSEDHGLIATIQKLSETAKRPIILTSNSSNLVLPNNMDRHELCFTKPSVKELFSHAKMVCDTEKVSIQPRLVKRFVGCCQGDIRKTILNLQFWCQGQKRRKDRKSQRKYGPVFYDIDAWHRMLPKILPWGYPSELSIKLEREISKSLLAEETSKLIEANEERGKRENEIQYSPKWRTPDYGNIKAKKEAILRRHFSAQNGIEFSSPEISNSTESPIAFTRRNVRRKLDTVLSSDSEGEQDVKDRIPVAATNPFGINSNDVILCQVGNAPPTSNVAIELGSNPVLEQLITSKKEINVEIFNPLSQPLNGTSQGRIRDIIHLSGSNFLENKNDDEILFAVDTAAPFCSAQTNLFSPAPFFCPTSVMCSTPLSEQPVISKECSSEKTFNPLSEPPLNGTCEGGLNDKILTSGTNLIENNDGGFFFQEDSSAPSYCEATEMCSDLAPGQFGTSKEEMSEESFNPLSEPLLDGTFKSLAISCAPELSFVPETEINGGIFSRDDDIIKPVDSTYNSTYKLERSPRIVKIFGVDFAKPRVDEGETNNEHVEEAGSRNYQVMDECSRIDFNGRSNFKDKPRVSVLPKSVEEMWTRLGSSHSDLRQYFTPEERDASVVMKFAYEMSNLISDADILLGDCQQLICDTLEPSMVSSERTHSFSWYDDHMSMTSTIAQHGICLYTKEISAIRPDNSSVNTADLAWEMIACSTSSTAMGNLVNQDNGIESLDMATPKSVFSLKSNLDSNPFSVIQSIVPARSYLATRSGSLYEYVSTLGQMSRSETSRLSESKDMTRLRRVRVARNYLSTGAMMLSPDDISLLGQYCNYKKDL